MLSTHAPGVGGTILRRLALNHFSISEAAYRCERTPSHVHARPLLSFSIEGSFRTTVETQAWQCEPHSLRLLPVGARHAESYSDGRTRSLLVEVDERSFRDVPELSAALQIPAQYAPGTVEAGIARRLRDALRENAASRNLLAEGLLFELLATLPRRREPSRRAAPPSVRRALDFLRDTFRQSVTMTEVARVADVHPASLSRAFRQHLGTTPGEYQRRLRLEWAREHVQSSTWSLGRIAVEAGFSDHAHFTRAFRAAFATSPSLYRAAFTPDRT